MVSYAIDTGSIPVSATMKTEHIAVTEALKKGYTVTDHGEVVAPSGKKRKLFWSDRHYYRFSVKCQDKVYGISVHRLAAYQKYGERLFEEGVVTRHLDGNPRNNSLINIAIGSVRDNIMDCTPESRHNKAVLAGRSKSHLTTEDVIKIREMFSQGAKISEVTDEYKIAKSTASYIKNGKTYKDLL